VATPSKPSTISKQPTNKKVAKAARAGGGPVKYSKKRLDTFSLSVIGVCLAGVALIVGSIYGRRILESAPFVGSREPRVVDGQQTRSGPFISKKLRAAENELKKLTDAKKPDVKAVAAAEQKLQKLSGDSHWHSAYGIFKCDAYVPPIDGYEFADPVGLHSHDDGLIHIHPFLLRVSGRKARLGEWMDSIYLDASKSQLKYPTPGTRNRTGEVSVPSDFVTLKAKDACKDKKGKTVESQISLYVWDSEKDKSASIYGGGFGDVRVGENKAYAFVIAPKGTKIPKPPSMTALASPSDVVSPLPAAAEIASGTPVVPGGKPVEVKVGSPTSAPAAGSVTTKPGSVSGSVTTKSGSVTTKVGSVTTKAGSVTTVAPTTAAPTTAASATTTEG
jgi:hypothetical protein